MHYSIYGLGPIFQLKIHTTYYFVCLYGGLSEHALATGGIPNALLSQTPSVLVSILSLA